MSLLEHKANTSTRIFRQFIFKDPSTGELKADDIVSRQCYELWVASRKARPKFPQKAFQRALSSHVCGVDGRLPFTPEEEKAILAVLRHRQVWPCYSGSVFGFGINGFRSRGFHEKLSMVRSSEASAVSSSAVAATVPSLSHCRGVGEAIPNPKRLKLQPTVVALPSPVLRSARACRFHNLCNSLLERFELAGMDGWESVLTMAKYYGMGMSGVTMDGTRREQIQLLFATHCARFPNRSVLILDPFAHTVSSRILLQNATSLQVLGPLTNSTRKLFDARDNWRALLAGLKAWCNPDKDIELVYRVHYRDGTTCWSTATVAYNAATWAFTVSGYVPLTQ